MYILCPGRFSVNPPSPVSHCMVGALPPDTDSDSCAPATGAFDPLKNALLVVSGPHRSPPLADPPSCETSAQAINTLVMRCGPSIGAAISSPFPEAHCPPDCQA